MSGLATRRIKVLAVSSGGGHWVQLCRVVPAFEGSEIVFTSVNESYARDLPGERVHVVIDATAWDRWRLVLCALQVLWVLLRERPHVIFTTGAAPGYLALRMGRWLGARTIWLDSIANVDEMSHSGRLARRYADLWLTQWPHLAKAGGPEYAGAVL